MIMDWWLNKDSYVGSWVKFDRDGRRLPTAAAAETATPSIRDEEEESQEAYQPRRPRSPIQRVLRYRLNDPELTSLVDGRYRPYDNTIQVRNRRQNRCERDIHPTVRSTQSYESNLNQQLSEDVNIRYNQVENETNAKILAVASEKEIQFTNRCRDLGVTFGSYKQQKIVDGQPLENVAIDMAYENKSFKVYGGYGDPRFAKDMAFIEGLRRLKFLFGEPGEHNSGFLKNPRQFLSMDGSQNSKFVPNPLHASEWAPPLPLEAPPPKPPLPNSPPPDSKEASSASMRRKTYAQPVPPGTDWESKKTLPYTYNFKSNQQQTTGLRSSWSEMSSNIGFFSALQAEKVNPEAKGAVIGYDTAKGYSSTSLVSEQPSSLCTASAATASFEMRFCKKIGSNGMFHRCNEKPVEFRFGEPHYSFEIEFWKWETQDSREKLQGTLMTDVKLAKESAFAEALNKLDKMYPDIEKSVEIVQDFGAGVPIWDAPINFPQVWMGAGEEIIDMESLRGRGRGRGLIIRNN